MKPEDTPVALVCTLAPGVLAQRRQEIVHSLFKHATGPRELPEGFEFIFPGDEMLIANLMDFIKFERNCCRFLRFELLFEPEQGPVHLRILGAPEAKTIIREMFGAQV